MLQVSEQIGKLDRQVTFLQKITVDGDSNEDKVTGWEEIDTDPTVSASRKEHKGSEIALADRVAVSQLVHFTIRFRSDITNEMRIVCEQKVYEVHSQMELGRRRYLTIVASLIDNLLWT